MARTASALRLSVIAVVLGSCSAGRVLPTPPPVVDVGMVEYAYSMPATVPGGRVVFRVANRGTGEHDLTLVTFPEDFPLTIDQQLRSDERIAVQTRARLAPRPPGATGSFAMDLAPGRYAVVCFVEDPDGKSHGQKGMSAEFRVR